MECPNCFFQKRLANEQNLRIRNTAINIVSFQAVWCDMVPNVMIPTDDHLKLYAKKRYRPSKALIIASTEASRRFRELPTAGAPPN